MQITFSDETYELSYVAACVARESKFCNKGVSILEKLLAPMTPMEREEYERLYREVGFSHYIDSSAVKV